jgi:ribosome-binding protein aMBF1 (putative translation factor)
MDSLIETERGRESTDNIPIWDIDHVGSRLPEMITMRPLRGAHRRLGDILREKRIEAGLRQADLAKRLGEPQSFVSKYESGERRLSFLDAVRICEALETPLLDVVERWKASEGGDR